MERTKDRKQLGKLKVDGTERAGEEVQLFLRKGHRAVERALKAGRKASGHLETGVCSEEVEIGQERRILPLGAGVFGYGLALQAWGSEHCAAGAQCAYTFQGGDRRRRRQCAPGSLRGLDRVEAGFPQLLSRDVPGAGSGLLGWLSRVFLGAGPACFSIRRLSMLRLPLVFHASVLEPDFDLPFGEVQQGGDLNAPRPAQVLVEVELLLQLQQLRVGVGRAQSAGAAAAALWRSGAI